MRSLKACSPVLPIVLIVTLLSAASAEAKTMNLGTALRYASTAPLPDVSASTG